MKSLRKTKTKPDWCMTEKKPVTYIALPVITEHRSREWYKRRRLKDPSTPGKELKKRFPGLRIRCPECKRKMRLLIQEDTWDRGDFWAYIGPHKRKVK